MSESYSDKKKYKKTAGDRQPRAKFPAVCAQCGKDCQVSFKPNGKKPVLCDDCFSAEKGFGKKSYGTRDCGRERDRNSGNWNNNRKSSGRDSFHRNSDTSLAAGSKEFEILNRKLDRILYLITSALSLKLDDIDISENEITQRPKLSKEKMEEVLRKHRVNKKKSEAANKSDKKTNDKVDDKVDDKADDKVDSEVANEAKEPKQE